MPEIGLEIGLNEPGARLVSALQPQTQPAGDGVVTVEGDRGITIRSIVKRKVLPDDLGLRFEAPLLVECNRITALQRDGYTRTVDIDRLAGI
ncbi:hypothetical protein D3C80_1013340 [compost metagenome]